VWWISKKVGICLRTEHDPGDQEPREHKNRHREL
jgi:hypothetical protein